MFLTFCELLCAVLALICFSRIQDKTWTHWFLMYGFLAVELGLGVVCAVIRMHDKGEL